MRAFQLVQGMFRQGGEHDEHEQAEQIHVGLAPSETSQLITANLRVYVHLYTYQDASPQQQQNLRVKTIREPLLPSAKRSPRTKAQALTGA